MSIRHYRRRRVVTAGGGGGGGFDPATLPFDGLYLPSFGGSPWTPTASAGTSGSNGNLVTLGVSPAVGTAVNGFTPGTFDGATTALSLGTAAFSSLVSSTALTLIALFKASASVAAATDFYDDPLLLGGSDGNTGLVYTSSGVRAGGYVGSAKQTVAIALATGTWAMCVMRYNGTSVKCRVSQASGTTDATPVVCGSLTIAANMFVGKNYASLKFLAGDVLWIGAATTEISDANLVNIRGGFNSAYGLSLT